MYSLFFVTPEQLLANEIQVSGSQAHHALAVLRIGMGQILRLGDGVGNWVEAEITALAKERFTCAVIARGRESVGNPAITVAPAILKGENQKASIDQLVQAGVDAIIPWRATRSVGAIDKREKWEEVIVAAAKQSRRATLPKIVSMIEISALAHIALDFDKTLVLHEGASTKISTAIAAKGYRKILVVVGPEGGLTQEEVEGLHGAGADVVRLGEPVVRADLAGALALAAIKSATGQW